MKKFRFFSIAVAVVMALFVAVWAATGSQKVTSGSSWGVAGVPVGVSTCSNELRFLFTTPPTNATITGMQFCPGASSVNKGGFAMDYIEIRCTPPSPPSNVVQIPWNGSGCVSTNFFNGVSARTDCYVKFCGRCTAGYTELGQYVPQCNRSFSGGNMTINYQY